MLFAALLAPALAHPAGAADYKVSINTVTDAALAQALQSSSTLIELEKAPPEDVTALRRRAQEDLDRLQKALRSGGYYDGKVSITVDGEPVAPAQAADQAADYDDTAKKKLPVKISVTPGPLYHLRKIAVVGTEGLDHPLKTNLDSGAPARAADIIAERRRLLDAVMRHGHPFAAVELKPAVVDHATHELDVTFAVTPGPAATLGPVTVNGLDRMSRDFMARRARFEPGTRYSPAALDALRSDLQSLDVFSSVKVTPADKLDTEGRLPVTVDVTERERHFIGFGANYSTNDGAGATAYWGDRNLFGGGERLRLDASVSGFGGDTFGGSSGATSDPGQADYSVSANFRKPDFWTQKQDFISSLALSDEHDPDTYDKRAVTATAGFERTLTRKLKVNFGWELEKARIDDHVETRDYLLSGPTAGVAYDTTNDLLNPIRGVRLTLGGEALPSWFGSSEDVFTTTSSAAGYLNLVGKGDLVLAGRVGFSNVFGSSLQDIPADRRLYAGGGGSVRGYAFRSISPEDSDGDLTGGRSAVTSSVELRYRFLDDYGIVPFFDAGTVSRDAMPRFDEPIRTAAGIGFRYYTGFGPIRADIAVPLNKRKDDDFIAFYVSIGQAF
jgi:translocation and assembly module TamA